LATEVDAREQQLLVSGPAVERKQLRRLLWFQLWYLIATTFLIVRSYALSRLVTPSFPWAVAAFAIAAWLLTFHLAGVSTQYKPAVQHVPRWIGFLFNFVGYSVALTFVSVLDGELWKHAVPRWCTAGPLFALPMTFLGQKRPD